MNDDLGASPFLRDLGLVRADDQLVLVANDSHMAWGALHGGVTASMVVVSAKQALPDQHSVSRTVPVSMHVEYPRAGRGSRFSTTTSVARDAQGLLFCTTHVHDEHESVTAVASVVLSEATGDESVEPLDSLHGDPSDFDAATKSIPFLARRGLRVDGVDDGVVEMRLPALDRNLDHGRTIHEGAVLTLLDAAGATAPWTWSREASSGATVALSAQFIGKPPADSVLARAVVVARGTRLSWTEVKVFDATDRQLCALGTVAYRFS